MKGLALTLVAYGGILWLASSPAAGDVRYGERSDPREQPPALSGNPRADIEQVRVGFDTSTDSLGVTVRFYDPLPVDDGLHYSIYVDVDGSLPDYQPAPNCGYQVNKTTLSINDNLYRGGRPPTLTASNFSGSLVPERAFSEDRREVNYTVADPRFAGLDLRCFEARLLGDAPPRCGDKFCSYISYSDVYDGLDTAGYFTGYGPPPAPACANGIDDDHDGDIDYPLDDECDRRSDNSESPPACRDGRDNDHDGRKDLRDPGCRGESGGTNEIDPAPVASTITLTATALKCGFSTEVDVLPNLRPLAVFPFKNIAVTVTGRGSSVQRRLPLHGDHGYRFAKLSAGRYTVTARYPGDSWRRASRTARRQVRIAASCG